jgi:hypothetical protein
VLQWVAVRPRVEATYSASLVISGGITRFMNGAALLQRHQHALCSGFGRPNRQQGIGRSARDR